MDCRSFLTLLLFLLQWSFIYPAEKKEETNLIRLAQSLQHLLQQDEPSIGPLDIKNDREGIMEIFDDVSTRKMLYGRGNYRAAYNHFSQELKKPADTWRVLRINDNPVGFTTFYMEKPRVGHITLLAVNKNHRRKGFGRLLMNEAIRRLKKWGAKIITIYTSYDNLKAQQLYQSLGFKVTGSIGINTLVLVKKIT